MSLIFFKSRADSWSTFLVSKIYFLQRERKHKKLYSDDLDFVDDELEAGRGFSLQEKLDSPKFSMDLFVLQMTGNEVTVEYFQRCGKFLKWVGVGVKTTTNLYADSN